MVKKALHKKIILFSDSLCINIYYVLCKNACFNIGNQSENKNNNKCFVFGPSLAFIAKCISFSA